MRKILYSLMSASAVVAVVFAASSAFFSDEETSLNNTFQAGTIDLLVGSSYDTLANGDKAYATPSSNPNNEAWFNLTDLKPGDTDQVDFELAVVSNDSWICARPTIDSSTGVQLSEYLQVRLSNGTTTLGPISLADYNLFGWQPLNDSVNQFLTNNGGAVPGSDGTSNFQSFAMEYCFGEFTTNGCEITGDYNAAQGQTVSAALKFYAVQSRNNEQFVCGDLNTPVVSQGAASFLGSAGARFRSFFNTGGSELYIGISNLGVGGNRIESNHTWISPGSHEVVVAYNQGTDTLTGSIAGTTVLNYTNFASNLSTISGAACTIGNLDVMQLSVVARDAGTTVELNNVDLSGYNLGNFTAIGNNNEWNNWNVTGFDFNSGFTLTADLDLTGTFSSTQEFSKVEVLFGCST